MFGDAQAYERFMGRWSRLVALLLVDFAEVPNSGRILDVGSGTGSLAFEIALRRNSVRVTGIDPSDEYVAFATSRNSFVERVEFQKGDAQALQFADRTFAASVSLLVFNFIPDAAKALRELRRVTQPKGRISAAVWDYGGRMMMLRTFWEAAASVDPAVEKRDERHMRLCREGELSALWRQGGLEAVREKPLEITMRFSSFADYWDPFLLGQGPAGAYVRAMPDSGRQALREALKLRLAPESETESFELPARVWAVTGSVPE